MSEQATIVISAVDKTSQVVKQIGAGVGKLESQFSALGAAVTGFAALAGVSAFTGMVSSAIEAADSMNDLSKKTGLAVETLSGLELAAKQSGTDLEGVSLAINKLGINIAKDGEKFARLGITAKEPLEAFKQLADVVSKIEDPQKRAAVAAEALGKSWQSAMPMLAEGGQKIQEMVDKGTDLSGMTKELAEQSDQFNDQMAELQLSFSSAAKRITLEMLPALNKLSKEFALGIQNSDGFFDAIQKYGLTNPFQSHEAKLAQLKKEFEQVDFRLSNDRAKTGDDALARSLQQQITYYSALTAKTEAAASSTEKLTKEQQASVDNFINGADAAAKAAAAAAAKAAKAIATTSEAAAKAAADLHIDQMALINKQAVTELVAFTKAEEDYGKAVAALISPLEKQAQQLEQQVEYYGMTESAIQATLVARLEEARFLAAENGAWETHLAFLDQEIAARQRIGKASAQKEFLEANKRAAEQSAKEWEKFSDDINRALTDALWRGFEDGKSFGQNFVDSLKNSLKTSGLKIVVNYVTNGAGQLVTTAANAVLGTSFSTSSGGGSAGSNALGYANNLSTAYSAYNNAGLAYQWATGSMSTANAAGTLYANATGTGLDGLLATNGAYGTAAGSSGTSTAGLSASTIGWVAAIVMGMYMSGEAWQAGIRWENYAQDKDAKRFDAEVGIRALHDEPARAIFGDKFVESKFYAVMSGSSLSAQIHGAIQKGLWGGDWQPDGSDSRLSGTFSEAAGGFYNGQIEQDFKKDGGWFRSDKEETRIQAISSGLDAVLDDLYRNVRNTYVMAGALFDDHTIAADLQSFSVSFARLSGTNLQASVNTMADSLAASMGNFLFPSVAAMQRAGEGWSAAFSRVISETNATSRMFDLMGDSLLGVFGSGNADRVLRLSNSLISLFSTVDGLNQSFSAYYGNFYTQAEKVDQSWEDMTKAFTQLDIAMPTTRQQFRGLVDSLDLSTTAGQGTFAVLMSLQEAFAALTPTLDDVAAAAAALISANRTAQAQQIGKLMDSERSARLAVVKTEIDAAQASAESARSIADSFEQIVVTLSAYQQGLTGGEMSVLSPAQKYSESKRLYDETASKARLGDVTAANQLATVADTFLKAAMLSGTAESYARDFAGVIGTIDSVVGVAGRQIPLAETQLAVAEAQLVSLNAILDKMSGGQTPLVVSNYQQAATDWASFFTTTAVGETKQMAIGAMQRISDSMGLFIDNAGAGYTFSSSDSPYALASVSEAWRQDMLTRYGQWQIPTFASGGQHAGGVRLVGENGPELEFTGPSSIINAAQTSTMLQSGNSMVAELRALRQEVASLRAEQRAGHAALASTTGRTARTLEKFDIDGLPEERAA